MLFISNLNIIMRYSKNTKMIQCAMILSWTQSWRVPRKKIYVGNGKVIDSVNSTQQRQELDFYDFYANNFVIDILIKWQVRKKPTKPLFTVNESLVILGEVRSWPWAFVSWQGVISYNVGIHLANLEQLILCYGSPRLRSWKVTIIIQTLHSH